MITGIVSVLMPHIRLVSISKSLYLDSFSVTFTDVFLSDGIAMSMNSCGSTRAFAHGKVGLCPRGVHVLCVTYKNTVKVPTGNH